MKCHHPKTYEQLGFDQIIDAVREKVVSEEALERCDRIRPFRHVSALLDELERVKEFKEILEFDDPFPANQFTSVSSTLKKVSVEGNWLSREELFNFLGWLHSVYGVQRYMKSRVERYPKLGEMVMDMPLDSELIPMVEKIVDERGNIRDTASDQLLSIRRSLRSASSDLRNSLNKILRMAKSNGWSPDAEVTIRNDRLVIPLKSDFKGRVSGFVHDISQSGQTVFIEPTDCLILNNQMKELSISERNEIIRILQDITAKIAEHDEPLRRFRSVMLKIELLRAKALLAVELEGILPTVEPEGDSMEIRLGYYPLLQLKAKHTADFQPIPLNIRLDPKGRIIIISGPNAGGKSVALKTLGLLQLMLQSGFLIPVHEQSRFRLFHSLFLDIGDDQSVDNDLSTYTSHLQQWRNMADRMNKNSLFLIDEFGSGTDPQQGGAIAEAFLERFVRQKAYGIITTHYGNLKDFAEATEGVQNAAMQFDTKELKPTYHLLEGMPGRSYAFEMAERVGVHHTVINRARKKIGKKQVRSEKLLESLEEKNLEINQILQRNKQKEKRLNELVDKNDFLNKKLDKEQKKILREAKLEANMLIKKANKRIEQVIREIKEKNADAKETQKLRKELRESAPEVEEVKLEELVEEKTQKQILKGPIEVGDWVQWKDSDTQGRVEEIQGKRVSVAVGEMRMTVKMTQLLKIRKSKKAIEAQKRGKNMMSTAKFVGEKMNMASSELDVRGMRVDEAIMEVTKVVDELMIAGMTYLRILHGKGTGALREAIRDHLRSLHIVESLEDAAVEQGGSGWTICTLK